MGINQGNVQPHSPIRGQNGEAVGASPQPGGASLVARGRQHPLVSALLVLLLVVLIVGGVFWYLAFRGNAAAAKASVGQASFISTGLVSPTTNQGTTDALQLNLQNLQMPGAGKSYYAWLLPDNDQNMQISPILLGTLQVKNGSASLNYPGDSTHDDLLADYSRFLVTEEPSNPVPTNPSLQTSAWRYYAAFSQVPNPQDAENHFSVLDHLRHLLSQDPKLKAVHLVGGLDTWLFHDTLKIVEWSGSARDLYRSGNTDQMQRQLTRILDYLDGSQYVTTENLPASVLPVLTDPQLSGPARVALLRIGALGTPPDYLTHIGNHLRALVQAPGVTSQQQQLAVEVTGDLDNVHGWLVAVHNDAAQLIHMTPDQLQQPAALALLNDLFVQADYAFIGQVNPNTGQVKEGVSQINNAIQRLATFNVTTCNTQNTANPCL